MDADTGMPVIPDGYFWRVKIDYELDSPWPGPSAVVQLRERRRIGSRRLARDDVYLYSFDPRDIAAKKATYRLHEFPMIPIDPDDWEEQIFELAEKVLEKQKKNLDEFALYAKQLEASARIKGDYPPKKLERTDVN